MSRFWQMFRVGFLAAAFLGLFGLAGLAATYLVVAPTLPSVRVLADVQLQVPLRVYTSDGKPIAVFGAKRRIPVAIEDVPEVLQQAFIAAEDDRFYEHPGVDYQGLVRAGWILLSTGEKSQGGSTITMQLARNFFLSFERTYIRKLKEILLALKIEHNFSKPRIFELYLNKIYLGHRAYGVAAAAQVYYGKSLYELTLAEAAMIAALPKAPSVINPLDSPDAAIERRNYVLARMLQERFISRAAYRRAVQAPDRASPHGTVAVVEAPYVAEMARLFALEQAGEAAYSGGFEIYTTVDSRLQKAAVQALRAGLLAYDRRHGYRGPEAHVELDPASTPADYQRLLANYLPYAGLLPGLVLEAGAERARVTIPDGRVVTLTLESVAWAQPYLNENAIGRIPEAVSDVVARGDIIRLRETDESQWVLAQVPEVQGAMVAMDSFDGSVRALVGGFDFNLSKFNRALRAKRQPGSSFKPFIYSAALNKDMTAATLINDAPVVYDDPGLDRSWRPQNYSETFYGPTRLREALVHSRNLVSIRVLRAIGVDYAIDYLTRFGFDPAALPRNLSLALGSAAVSPYEMARAYAVFANGGFRVTPHIIERVVGPDGRVLYDADPALACLECTLPVAQAVVSAQGEIRGGMPPPQKVAVLPRAGTNGREAAPGYVAQSEKTAHPGEPTFSLAPRVIEAGNAYIMDSFMEDVVRRGTATRALALGRNDLSGKTGTTNQQTNAWFCGYVPGLVATVWVGFDQPRPLGAAEVGGRAALPVWMDFMEVALAHKPERDLPMPTGVVTVRIDPDTGRRARAGDPDAILELFQAGNVPPLGPALEPIEEEPNPYGIF